MKNRNSFVLIACIIIIIIVGYGVFQQQNQKNSTTPVQTEPVVQPIQTTFHLFFPYDTGTDFALKEVTALVTLAENETPLDRLQELLRAPSAIESTEQLVPVLGPNARVLSVETLDDETLRVNVNKEFITEMNAGASFEGAILRGFIRSICSLYDAKGVRLLVDGEAYESGHYKLDYVVDINEDL